MAFEVSLSKSIYASATVALSMPLFHTVSLFTVSLTDGKPHLAERTEAEYARWGGWLAPFINGK